MSLHHLLFAIAFCVAVFIANAYIYRQLFRVIFPRFKGFFLVVCIVLFISNVVFLFSMRANFLPDFLYTTLSILLGFSFFFFLIALIYDIVKFIAFKSVKNIDTNRRKTLKLICDLGVLFVAFGCFLQGIFKAIKIPPIKYVDLNANLGIKIAMISDVHLGKNLHKDFLEKLIAKINEQEVDYVVIVGDLIDTNIDDIDYLDLLNTFNKPCFYVTGNHEYYHDATKIIAKLKQTNIKVLENESIDLGKIVLSGINDLKGAKYGMPMDLAPIYKNFNDTKYNILLAHQPVVAKEFDLSRFDLVLSGHTHAGQIFPFSIFVLMQQGFLHGLYEIGKKTKLYVSSGAGFWGPSIRFLAPSEIVIIRL
ncbi:MULTISPECIES: metallophosphoesterase [unclassified Campylobacter]|uniref:metallophosphoesterase n=1 Tax=unclassified Campylobacter TaxID=2593542 RepID=UPI003014A78C